MSIARYRGKAGPVFWPTCDGCGKQLLPESCWADAREAMKAAKWKFVRDAGTGEWTHLCPVCVEVEREEAEI